MQNSLRTICAAIALLVGFSSFAERAGRSYPPPQPECDYDCDDGQESDVPAPPPLRPPPEYYEPGQSVVGGDYDDNCLPDWDPDLFYNCPYAYFDQCVPVAGPYGYRFPYPYGVSIDPVFARAWWHRYGRGVIEIYRQPTYQGYRPRVVQPYSGEMQRLPQGGFVNRGPVVVGPPAAIRGGPIAPPPTAFRGPPMGMPPRGMPFAGGFRGQPGFHHR